MLMYVVCRRNVYSLFQGQTLDNVHCTYLFNLVGGVVLKQDGLVLLLGGQHTPIHRLIIQHYCTFCSQFHLSSFLHSRFVKKH